MKKRLKIILIILSIVLVFLLYISNCIFEMFKKNKVENYYTESLYSPSKSEVDIKYSSQIDTKYFEIMQDTDKIKLEKAIDSIIELINTKNYEALYEKLDSNSTESFYPTRAEFEQDCMKKILDSEYTCDEFIADFYGYDCIFYPKDAYGSTTEREINLIIVLSENKDDYTIILNRLLNVNEGNGINVLDGLVVSYEKELNYLEKTSYVITLVNDSREDLEIDFNYICATIIKNGYEDNKYIDDNYNILLKPKEIKTLELEFDQFAFNSQKPEFLKINLNINGKTRECLFYIYSNYFIKEEVE